MAKLTRLTAKVFGETADGTLLDPEIGQFGSAKAGTYNGTGDVATIQSLPAWSNGWIDAVTPTQQFPPLPEMTGVHKVMSYQEAYLLQQGIPEWDSATTYYTNGFCSKAGKIYISQSDNNLNHDPESDNTNWKEFTSGSSRNIGEIVTSTLPLTDAGLHLLDGALISGTGAYSDFYNYMDNLETEYLHNPNFFCSEADWQTSVTTYGSCGKFVIDRVNQTIRLPKISDILQGTTDVTALGNLIQAGLPNIAGSTIFTIQDGNYGSFSGSLYSISSGSLGYGGGGVAGGNQIGFDASRSNSIYGNSNTVQPQAIKVLYYIVIATTTKTEIEVDIDEIATDLNGKADVDLTNINQTGKDAVMALGIPDYKNGEVVSLPNNVWRTATKNLCVSFFITGGADGWLGIALKDENGVLVPSGANDGYVQGYAYLEGKMLSGIIPKSYSYMIGGSVANAKVIEYPLKGAN